MNNQGPMSIALC